MRKELFRFPPNLESTQRLSFTISVIEKLRAEAHLLRRRELKALTKQKDLEKEVDKWKKKYKKKQEELKEVKQENGKLKKEIEKITKTNKRYQVALFDHGNFKHQDETSNKKSFGGQKGHADTNRENREDFTGYESFERRRIYAKNCGTCGSLLSRVSSTKNKILIDIVVNPKIVEMIISSERQWCGECKKEVNTKDPQTLPFTEYGLNTFMMVMILRYKAHSSFSTIAKVIHIGFGLQISSSDVSNILKSAAKYLGIKYEELKEAVRRGEVMYCDETGWSVKKQRAWMWIMTTEDELNNQETVTNPGITVYVAAESRGKGIAEELYGESNACCMTDGFYSYLNAIPRENHLYCWAHLLRFAYEETEESKKDSQAVFLKDALVRIYHIKFEQKEGAKEELEEILKKELDQLVLMHSDEVSFQNIQNRLRDQKMGLIKALIMTKSGTNNLAERELRTMAISRNISYGSNTFKVMETTAINASVIQTLSRNPKEDLLTELSLTVQIGIPQKNPQYKHLSFNST